LESERYRKSSIAIRLFVVVSLSWDFVVVVGSDDDRICGGSRSYRSIVGSSFSFSSLSLSFSSPRDFRFEWILQKSIIQRLLQFN